MRLALRLGANYLGQGRCAFRVWAPHASSVDLHLIAPEDREVLLRPSGSGYWSGVVDQVQSGARYFYELNGGSERPDPASRFQPEGVHGPSAVVDPAFNWTDQGWFGRPLRDYIIYELHVGTFTAEGTFDSIIPQLPRLQELGVTALELMPIAQFPGPRNWGYDGVDLFAAQNSYGGPAALKRLVNACHHAGLAVVLDVVYNHFGPEGNYLADFGPYFNQCYKSLWGAAINFDGPHSDDVRRFFLENALYWQTDCHIDALRLDAVHAIRDFSALPFLLELAKATRAQAERLNRRFFLIAESDLNDPRTISPETLGGLGLDAQWSDDFHHALHVLLTGETYGYYEDFRGVRQFAKILREGFAFSGEHSRHRQRRHGNVPRVNASRQFVVYAQNHDQIGNRQLGDRLSRLTSFEALKLAAGSVLLSPFIPMLFMGEEYGESAPFQYMTSHSDPELVELVRQGRRQEFAHFHASGPTPDPQAEETFLQNKLDLDLPRKGKQHELLHAFYRELIRLRKEIVALAEADKSTMEVMSEESASLVLLRYWSEWDEVLVLLCFADELCQATVELPPGPWRQILDSSARHWGGAASALPSEITDCGSVQLQLSGKSLAVYQRFQDPQ